MAKHWTGEELEYLENNWGHKPVKSLSKKLKRSENAIVLKAARIGLGAFLDNGEYITFNQLLLAMGMTGDNYKVKSWIDERGFPVLRKKVRNSMFRVVYLEDFWEWAERNKNFIDFSKVEKNILGKEPLWVETVRQADIYKAKRYKITPWTKFEDNLLLSLLKSQKYTCCELSARLGRSEGAVIRRCSDLGTLYRPIKEAIIPWKQSEIDMLIDLIRKGANYEYIALKLCNRSVKSIRGMVCRICKTEDLDKASCFLSNERINQNERTYTKN